MKELDEVIIPSSVAQKEGIVQRGTIVWYIDGADYATVECSVIDDNPHGLATKLVDVDINHLRQQ